jgi:F420-non-reducing hydrogenase iron-sulfur subunit
MTIKRMTFLQELLAFIGLEGRLHLEWISSAEAQKFARVVTDFTETVRALGPNPIRDWRVFNHLYDTGTAAANASHAGGA